MQTIDFTKGIGYKINNFPDGEKQLVLNGLNRKDTVEIICRIKSSDDLFLLMQCADILKRQEVTVERLVIPYLMSMRNDRVISYNGAYTLKIVADCINLLNAEKVYITEAHSSKTTKLIRNCINYYDAINLKLSIDYTVCYPDKGAADRSGLEALFCQKVRDMDDPSIITTEVVNPSFFKGGAIVVKDDLCDGGGTFLSIAPKLRELNPTELILCVTHAIQKVGIEKVAAVYDEVYISDSYADWDKEELPPNVSVIKL